MNWPGVLGALRSYADAPRFDRRHVTAHEAFLPHDRSRLTDAHHALGQRAAHAVYHAALEHGVDHVGAARRGDDTLHTFRNDATNVRTYPGAQAMGTEHYRPGEVRHDYQTSTHLAGHLRNAVRVGAHDEGFGNNYGIHSDNAHAPGGARTLEERLERNRRRDERRSLGERIERSAHARLTHIHGSLEALAAHHAPPMHVFRDAHGDHMPALIRGLGGHHDQT